MTRIKGMLAAAAAVLLILAAPAFAQYKPWPTPLPTVPRWGDYDSSHTWRDAAWWWQSQPDWVKQHHPEWWGDFDSDNQWHPAWWWWESQPAWVREHHPEWWGDYYEGQWYPATWWYQYQPEWAHEHQVEIESARERFDGRNEAR